MSAMSSLPSYTDVADALQKTGSPLQAAEVHGLFCGIICATPDNTDTHWEKLVMGPKKIALAKPAWKNYMQRVSITSVSFL